MSAGAPRFRPDLEGLRGVAILLVVLFHAGVVALAGGFVAVDVFFVLSGFFITGVLARELDRDGRVDLTKFWGGRALRLLPALLVVLIATLGLVMWLYAPIDRAAIASTGRSVALYAGNIEFANNAIDYFSSSENPLLHTWSLGVEEQFYLVWPLLFVMVALLAGGGTAVVDERDGALTRRRLLIGVVTAGLMSLLASLWITSVSPPSAFFGMTTRIWEFALGGVLALWLSDDTAERGGVGVALQAGGLVAIAIAVAAYDRSTSYPGTAALVPALGATALLVGGHLAPASVVSRALANDSLRWLGRLSYAWYLWHWPLVGLGAVLLPGIGVGGKLAWSGLALVLSWLTHRFIEGPARNGALARIPAGYVAPVALAVSVAAAGIAHVSMNVAARQAATMPQKMFAAARGDRMDHQCWSSTVERPVGLCEFGDRSSNTVIVLFGDSHAEHWLGGLDLAGRQNGWKVVAMVKGGCPVPTMTAAESGRIERWYRECTRYREASIKRIVDMRPAAVLLSNWDHYLPMNGANQDWHIAPATWRKGLRKTYERFTGAGIRTIVMRGTPRTWFDVPACLSRRAAGVPFARECSYDRARALLPDGPAAQDHAARGLPVRFVDMNDQICASPRCGVMRGGVVMFTDDNHLTRTFSRTMAPVLGQRIAAALR